MRKSLTGAALAALLIASPALADPATPEGASAALARYAAVIGQAAVDKGAVSVKPDGDSYVVTWTLDAIIPKPKSIGDPIVSVAPFSYRETPKGEGAFAWHADSFPKISISDNSDEPGTLLINGDMVLIDVDFDPHAPEPLHATADIGKFSVDFTLKKSDGPVDYHATTADQHVDVVAKKGAADGTVDLTLRNTASSGVQRLAASIEAAKGAEVDATLNEGTRHAAIAIQGLRSDALGAVAAYLAAHKDEAALEEDPQMADLIKAAIPFFDHFALTGDQSGDKLVSAVAVGGFDKTDLAIESTGAAPDDRARLHIAFDKLTAASPLLPAWTASVFPLSFDMDWRVEFHGLDKAAALAVESGGNGDGDAIQGAITQQPARLDAKASLRSPIIALDATSQATLTPPPSGTTHVTADGLDKLADLIKKIGLDPHDTQQYLAMLAAVGKIARKDADGHLAWDVQGAGQDVRINGTPLTKLMR